ncbi:hypothetical protein [Paenibacillus sp. NPDC101420]|uniref:hypothetical protein n=1 Tax=Paenibacillus sp. NPDC101420 TaxID=3390602 RepID=UPI003D046A25
MERVKIFEHAKMLCNNPFPPSIEYEPTEVTLGYWLQEAKMLRDTIEMAMNEYHLWQSGDTAAPMMYGILQEAMSTLYPDTPAPTSEITARPIDEWNEDLGDVLWWTFPVNEPPYCGSPLDMDWPDYHTHWTPIVIPAAPAPKEGE